MALFRDLIPLLMVFGPEQDVWREPTVLRDAAYRQVDRIDKPI